MPLHIITLSLYHTLLYIILSNELKKYLKSNR